MITLDPLYFLLLLEGLLLQTVGLIMLFWLWRKAKRDLREVFSRIPEEKPKEPVPVTEKVILTEEITPVVQDESSGLPTLELGEVNPEKDNLQTLLDEKTEIIVQMKKKIEAMEKKYEDMENEYLILFDQSQKQEQALKAAGLSLDNNPGDF